MIERRRVMIIGATSAIAQHCARYWVKSASSMLLVGRNEGRLSEVAADLRVRGPQVDVRVAQLDFNNAEDIQSLIRDYATTGAIDIALIAQGSLPDQAACENSLSLCADTLGLNGISPALFMEALANEMSSAGGGQLGVIGSVAGDRGRKSNYVYGAAKGMLERYAQGLQHRTAGSGLGITLIKPGPTLTPMTAHLQGKGPALADVEDVARCIVDGMQKQKPVVYVPGKWLLIMLVIRHLPRWIFNRLDI
jgi:decaprenylphospho-beta-D-erythro-pentofuranosid-2-ulose 2-reductase